MHVHRKKRQQRTSKERQKIKDGGLVAFCSLHTSNRACFLLLERHNSRFPMSGEGSGLSAPIIIIIIIKREIMSTTLSIQGHAGCDDQQDSRIAKKSLAQQLPLNLHPLLALRGFGRQQDQPRLPGAQVLTDILCL